MAASDTTNVPQQNAVDETLVARQYGRDVQHIVFGIHGTANNPGHVRPLTEQIGSALSNTPNSGTNIDTSFDWSKNAGFLNQPGGREKEGDRFAAHVDKVLTEMRENGTLNPNKPVQITVVGFSHGGNVAIASTPELSDVMRKHGLHDNGSLHLVTVSTPAYNNGGNEDPTYARREAANRGVDVHHTHFSPKNDGVIRMALGNAYYDGPGHPNKDHRDGHVYNYGLEGKGFLNPIGSHGSAQDDAATARNINNQADKVANIVAARTLDIHNRNGRPRPGGRLAEGDDGVEVAVATTESNDPKSRQSANETSTTRELRGERQELAQGTIAAMTPGNDNLNRQFAQALQGTNGDRDAAAAALDALRNSPGYKADQDVAVVQGRNGQLIATQGQVDAALNVPVGKVNPGDFERVANQIAQTPQPTQVAAVQPEQPERARTV
jgi:hypothetical protein